MENYFTKAKENVQVAENCFENGWYNASVNRSYYAAYQAAIVAIYKAGFKDKDDRYENKHKWVQSTFSGVLIHQKKYYPSYLKSYLIDMHFERINADYKDMLISKSVALKQLKKASEFIETISKKIGI